MGSCGGDSRVGSSGKWPKWDPTRLDKKMEAITSKNNKFKHDDLTSDSLPLYSRQNIIATLPSGKTFAELRHVTPAGSPFKAHTIFDDSVPHEIHKINPAVLPRPRFNRSPSDYQFSHDLKPSPYAYTPFWHKSFDPANSPATPKAKLDTDPTKRMYDLVREPRPHSVGGVRRYKDNTISYDEKYKQKNKFVMDYYNDPFPAKVRISPREGTENSTGWNYGQFPDSRKQFAENKRNNKYTEDSGFDLVVPME